ncbi:MAG: hypothetical protein ACOYNF_19125 [Rhodoferax sp.]
MELRIINDQPHIVIAVGKKETITPASEVIAMAHSRIAAANAMLASLAQASTDAQANLENALLRGEASAQTRIEQASLSELQVDQQHELADATADIEHVTRLIDQYRAQLIKLADQAAIAELTRPFITFLESQNVHN